MTRLQRTLQERDDAKHEVARLHAVLESIAAGTPRPDELARLALKHATTERTT